MKNIHYDLIVSEDYAGMRLDHCLASMIPEHSRARLQQWIKSGEILINGNKAKARDTMKGAEHIIINAEAPPEPNYNAQEIALDLIHVDDDMIVLNKPAGLVVHPAAGNYEGTLLNALLFHFPELAHVPRAGIIHRLDKDTSGLLIIARNLTAHTQLINMMREHKIEREYIALATGHLTAGDTIDAPLARHGQQRTKMTVTPNGKPAITHYRVIQRYGHFTLLRVNLETGRTHQIRVHLAHIKHPLVGDPLYGRLIFPKGASEPLREALRDFKRQALHAHKLTFLHPRTSEPCEFTAPLPKDFESLLRVLQKESS
ncbi:MAG: 23S rRNA pseudouridine(1911/1915/1917) synthase RluD [Gammaproteobacteria bacterium]|nr:23S rRNA pseudouridine(1911/1915/1917) synthase RluD [Gammaproteobacteria bacterium]